MIAERYAPIFDGATMYAIYDHHELGLFCSATQAVLSGMEAGIVSPNWVAVTGRVPKRHRSPRWDARNLDRFRAQLERFDWWHSYSDDPRVRREADVALTALNRLLRVAPEDWRDAYADFGNENAETLRESGVAFPPMPERER